MVYFPQEELDVPEVTGNMPLAVVKGLTTEEILEKIIQLGSGIALHQETLDDIYDIINTNQYGFEFVVFQMWHNIVFPMINEVFKYFIMRLSEI